MCIGANQTGTVRCREEKEEEDGIGDAASKLYAQTALFGGQPQLMLDNLAHLDGFKLLN